METDRMMYSRRDFGRLVTAGLPLALVLRARADSKINGVQIGAITYSFRTMTNPDDIIAAYQTIGLSQAELMSNHAEALAGAPPGPAFGGGRGRGPQMTEEQRAAAEKARLERAEQMRQWRTSVSMDKFKDVRKKFNDAGVDVRLLCYNMKRQQHQRRRDRICVPAGKGPGRESHLHLDAGQHGQAPGALCRQASVDGRVPRA